MKKIIHRIIDAFTEDTSKLSLNERIERLEECKDNILIMQIANLLFIIYLYLKLMTIA